MCFFLLEKKTCLFRDYLETGKKILTKQFPGKEIVGLTFFAQNVFLFKVNRRTVLMSKQENKIFGSLMTSFWKKVFSFV